MLTIIFILACSEPAESVEAQLQNPTLQRNMLDVVTLSHLPHSGFLYTKRTPSTPSQRTSVDFLTSKIKWSTTTTPNTSVWVQMKANEEIVEQQTLNALQILLEDLLVAEIETSPSERSAHEEILFVVKKEKVRRFRRFGPLVNPKMKEVVKLLARDQK